MATFAKRTGLLAGASVVALVCGLNLASAATITVLAASSYATDPGGPSPFALLSIPGSGTNTFISSNPFTSGGVSVSFSGGAAGPSGVYAGSTSIASSPFGASNSTRPYLVAESTNGTVTLNYATAQTQLNLLWGTVDTDAGRNNVSIAVDGVTITGAQILAAAQAQGFGTFSNGTADVYLSITGLGPFNTAVFSDTSTAAFEFAPGVASAVPEPATWGMMLLGFAGLGFAFRQSRRKVSFA